MPSATVVRAWQDATTAYLAVRVVEGGRNVEYVGAVPLADLEGLSAAEQKAALVVAAKVARDVQQASRADIAGISGTVTI
jgi:hypothetical protein